VAAGEEGVMFIEIPGSPVGVGLFCVLQQELALEAGQIVHEYNYYRVLAIGCVCEVVVRCMFRYVISCYLGVL
jgi:hypothetical protein